MDTSDTPRPPLTEEGKQEAPRLGLAGAMKCVVRIIAWIVAAVVTLATTIVVLSEAAQRVTEHEDPVTQLIWLLLEWTFTRLC
jgi:hypothetical protein